ncbi:hypothetical protein [Gallibacterium anatis]|uniref:hypothetical protein n=1 Tax=Gallibacterium anatis TaxID=750 RepID=UPI000AFEA2FE|nr:hypothetical protein [Gallibacterium anatis]
MSYLSQLTQKLREIFQTDRADLDFGIYRILNSRSEQINDYLNRKLPQKVQRAFNAANQGQIEQWQKALDEAIKQAQDLGVNPQDSAKVQNLKAQIAQAKNSGANSEAAVFSHLYTFFSRYTMMKAISSANAVIKAIPMPFPTVVKKCYCIGQTKISTTPNQAKTSAIIALNWRMVERFSSV